MNKAASIVFPEAFSMPSGGCTANFVSAEIGAWIIQILIGLH
jgi:hypothetical protein